MNAAHAHLQAKVTPDTLGEVLLVILHFRLRDSGGNDGGLLVHKNLVAQHVIAARVSVDHIFHRLGGALADLVKHFARVEGIVGGVHH